VLNKTDEIKQKRAELAVLFGNECKLCIKKFGKNFHFHHIGYKNNEKKHSDFTTHYEYTIYMIPIIRSRVADFALLCKTCHHLITILQAITDNSRFERVVELARKSRRK